MNTPAKPNYKKTLLACYLGFITQAIAANFATCPIEHLVDEGKGMTILQLFKSPLFWVAVVLMVCSGASEISMAQWASAFVESGLEFSKTVCDLAGPCLFGITMGICRTKHSWNDFSKSWRQNEANRQRSYCGSF